MALAYLARESELSAEKWNNLFSEANRKLSLALDNHSLCFARTPTNPEFFRRFMGQEFHFGTNGFFRREIWSGISEPLPKLYTFHAVFGTAANTTQIATEYTPHVDHDRKIVRLKRPAQLFYSQIGRADSFNTGVSLFDYSLEVHTKLHRQNAGDPLEPYFILGEGKNVFKYADGIDELGSSCVTLERVHNFDQVELIFEGLTSFDFPANYNKYNFFRLHNLALNALTVNFPTGFSVSIPAGGSRCVRRTSVNGTYTEGFNHFQRMLPGDLRMYNAFEQFGAGMRDHAGMTYNNVCNPAMLLRLFFEFSETVKLPKFLLDYSQMWDASSIYCNPNYSAVSSWEVNPPVAGKGFFGEVADATPIGDLFYHFGDMMKVTVTSATETHERITFNGFANLEADMSAAGITVTDSTSHVGKLKTFSAASGVVDLVQLSTNLVAGTASGWDFSPPNSAGSANPVRFPVKQLPIYMLAPEFEFHRSVGVDSITEVAQKNLDGTLKTPLSFSIRNYSDSSFKHSPSLNDSLSQVLTGIDAATNATTTFETEFKFTGFGPLFITSKSQPIRSYSSQAQAKDGVTLSGTRIVTQSVRHFPDLGWQKLRVESQNATRPTASGMPVNVTLSPQYAFNSPRVEQVYCDYLAQVTSTVNGTIFHPNRTSGTEARFYHPDYDYYFLNGKTGDTTCRRIKRIKKKTGISCLSRFDLSDLYFRLHNWALGRKTSYTSDPQHPYVAIDPNTDSNRWYPNDRARILRGEADEYFGRWAQFNRLLLLVDYYNNIASYVNAVTRVYPLNFIDFFGLHFDGNTGITSTSYLTNIRPANQFKRFTHTDDTHIALMGRLSVPLKTISHLPSTFQELKDAKVKIIRRTSSTSGLVIQDTSTPLYSGPLPVMPANSNIAGYSWVTIEDVSAAAGRLGLRFVYQQVSVPVSIEIVTAGFSSLYGNSDEWTGSTQINFYGFVEQATTADWCADVSTYRLKTDDLEPADIITYHIGFDNWALLSVSDTFRKRRYDHPDIVSQMGSMPLHTPDRSHPALRINTSGTRIKAILEPATWIQYAENFSGSGLSSVQARQAYGVSVIPAEIKPATGPTVILDSSAEGGIPNIITNEADGAANVSFFFDSTVEA